MYTEILFFIKKIPCKYANKSLKLLLAFISCNDIHKVCDHIANMLKTADNMQ